MANLIALIHGKPMPKPTFTSFLEQYEKKRKIESPYDHINEGAHGYESFFTIDTQTGKYKIAQYEFLWLNEFIQNKISEEPFEIFTKNQQKKAHVENLLRVAEVNVSSGLVFFQNGNMSNIGYYQIKITDVKIKNPEDLKKIFEAKFSVLSDVSPQQLIARSNSYRFSDITCCSWWLPKKKSLEADDYRLFSRFISGNISFSGESTYYQAIISDASKEKIKSLLNKIDDVVLNLGLSYTCVLDAKNTRDLISISVKNVSKKIKPVQDIRSFNVSTDPDARAVSDPLLPEKAITEEEKIATARVRLAKLLDEKFTVVPDEIPALSLESEEKSENCCVVM